MSEDTTTQEPITHRTPEEDAEWVADKRAEYDADMICGDYWSNW